MYQRILIPTDGSAISRKAVKHGIALAKSLGASVVAFFAPEDYRAIMYTEYMPAAMLSQDEFEAQAKKAADKQLLFVQKAADAAGIACETYWTTSVAPWEAIIEAAIGRAVKITIGMAPKLGFFFRSSIKFQPSNMGRSMSSRMSDGGGWSRR